MPVPVPLPPFDEHEDKDGFEDEDGCPDRDNDQDGFRDRRDKCPNEAEDKDGFQDDDGCPDPDNDKDRILDRDDQCPNEPERYNHYKDEDGWYLLVNNRCRHILGDGRCGIYDDRPRICREYTNDFCEFDEPADKNFELYFDSYTSLLKYIKQRFKSWDRFAASRRARAFHCPKLSERSRSRAPRRSAPSRACASSICPKFKSLSVITQSP